MNISAVCPKKLCQKCAFCGRRECIYAFGRGKDNSFPYIAHAGNAVHSRRVVIVLLNFFENHCGAAGQVQAEAHSAIGLHCGSILLMPDTAVAAEAVIIG